MEALLRRMERGEEWQDTCVPDSLKSPSVRWGMWSGESCQACPKFDSLTQHLLSFVLFACNPSIQRFKVTLNLQYV